MARDYDVGYRKPPKTTRFKPGKSGNPKGRPKGSSNISTDLARELSEKISIRENGQPRRLSRQKVMIKRLIAKGMEGDVRAISTVLELAASFESNGSAADTPSFNKDELLILQRFAPRAADRVRAKQRKKLK